MKKLHSWNLSYSQARECQKELASKLRFTPLKKPPELIAGIDCAFSKGGGKIVAAVVVLGMPDFAPIETVSAVRKVTFPYIPGLLSFRESPVCIAERWLKNSRVRRTYL
ncbi:MAG: endonuclease V [Planctomycetota bacterium]